MRRGALLHEVRRAGAAFGLAWALLCGTVARAEVFLVLPPAEPAGGWTTPASVAGLTVASGPRPAVGADAVVRAEPNGAGWILRATNAAGLVRTARVAAPATPADREEIAHLAAALARDLAQPTVEGPSVPARDAPRRTTVVPPPPPPPVAARAVTAPPDPVRVDTIQSSGSPPRLPPAPAPAQAPPALFPPPTAVAESPVGDVVAPWTDLTLVGTFDPRPTPPALPRAERRRVLSPPLAAWTGAGLRPGVQPAFLQRLGWDPARLGSAAVSVTVGFAGPHDLLLSGEIDRQVTHWEFDLAAMRTFTRVLRGGVVTGVSYRLYQQQQVPIDQTFAPYVAARGELAALGVGAWRFGPLVQAGVDLAWTSLVDETGRARVLSPVQVDVALQARFVPRRSTPVDPFRATRTSKGE